jgi:hypothetical protein
MDGQVNAEGAKSEYGMAVLGLEWPEPLVTFALSCGSWSSPAVSSCLAPLNFFCSLALYNSIPRYRTDRRKGAVAVHLFNCNNVKSFL